MKTAAIFSKLLKINDSTLLNKIEMLPKEIVRGMHEEVEVIEQEQPRTNKESLEKRK